MIISSLTRPALAQAPSDFERLVDEIFAIQDEDINYEDLYENLAQLYSNQADLNTISEEQLRSIYLLNEFQIQSFFNYRKEAGPFISIYELQNINGFTEDVIQRLIPFVRVKDATLTINKTLFRRILEEKNNYLILRYDRTVEEKKGYKEEIPVTAKYAGSPDRIYARFQTRRTGDFSLGFTAEKDAGEQFIWSANKRQYGADYISYYAQVLNKGKIKNLILGDYQAQFGQGLVLGSAFGIGKNSEAVTTVRKGNLGFLPYSSVYEARFLRGAAISYSVSNKITVHGMISSRWRDGNIKQDTTEGDYDLISSLQLTGLHRTPAELANRKTVLEKNIATVVNYKHQHIEAGILLHHTHFNVQLIPTSTLYNQFNFKGSTLTNAGFYLNYNWNNFTFFSEAGHSINKGTGTILGIVGSITPAFDISLLFRKFDRNYISFHSNALSENTTPQNETGIYWGWKYAFNKKYIMSGYFDLFQFPWLRYRAYVPSEGTEWLLRLNYKPSKTISMFLQAREETKVRNNTSDNNLYMTQPGTKRNYWINVDYQVASHLTFKTRAQFSTYSLGLNVSDGMMLLQDVVWHSGKITISGRYALFDTDDYDNRLYVYEKDVWLAFSFPAYYGIGVRNYLLFQYSVSKSTDIWLRWAHVRYTDRDVIGSGSETIEGNIRNDIKFQMRIRL
jgi:hypothetical protein